MTIDVYAEGCVQDTYDYATIHVSITDTGTDGPAAKEKTRKISSKVLATLKGLRERGISFREKELRTKFDVSVNRVWDSRTNLHKFDGYKACFTITLTTDEIKLVGAIQDALSSIAGAEVNSPILHLTIEKKEKMRDAALRVAHDLAKARFAHQCKIVEVPASGYYLKSWATNYDPRSNKKPGWEICILGYK